MIIDASLGRGGCCGFPSCSGGSQRPPQPPQPPTEPDALYVVLSTTQSAVANGAVIPLSGNIRQIGNGLSFDASNHAVTVNESGVYLFNWHVLVQSTDAAADVVITLQSLDGMNVIGTSAVVNAPAADDAALLSGSTVAFLRAGMSYALVNASGVSINIPAAGTAPAAFAASLTVSEVGSSNLGGQQQQVGGNTGNSCGSGGFNGFNGFNGSGSYPEFPSGAM